MTRNRLSSSVESGTSLRGTASALDFALRRLARRAHSEGELVGKMTRAGFPREEIAAALDYLRARRYVDDEAFGRGFAVAAAERKHWGPARIGRRLRDRGLSETQIESALAEAFPSGEDRVIEQALARFRRRARDRGTPQQRKARAYRHLFARGFSPEAIREALSREAAGERRRPQ
ncbi:MAG: regulatory protein RecX [Acidobacteriota bacterium]